MRTKLNDVLYYTAFVDIPQTIVLKDSEFIITESITSDFVKNISIFDYKVAFIGNENIFSHAMNVVRKVVSKKRTIIIVGISNIIYQLEKAESCSLVLAENKIILDGDEYIFQKFCTNIDADEDIEYNVHSGYICYKPDYHYSNELSIIIREGFNHSKVTVNDFSVSCISIDNKVWNLGIGFPSEIYDRICSDLKNYFKMLLEYLDILENITKYYQTNEKSDGLVELLEKHFAYTTLFSFDLSKASAELHKELLDEKVVDKYYRGFSLVSPISNKEKFMFRAMEQVRELLMHLIRNDRDAFSVIYPEFKGIKVTDAAILFFIMHLFSDIRRCVIGTLIENNKWFASICTHKRRKEEVY